MKRKTLLETVPLEELNVSERQTTKWTNLFLSYNKVPVVHQPGFQLIRQLDLHFHLRQKLFLLLQNYTNNVSSKKCLNSKHATRLPYPARHDTIEDVNQQNTLKRWFKFRCKICDRSPRPVHHSNARFTHRRDLLTVSTVCSCRPFFRPSVSEACKVSRVMSAKHQGQRTSYGQIADYHTTVRDDQWKLMLSLLKYGRNTTPVC